MATDIRNAETSFLVAPVADEGDTGQDPTPTIPEFTLDSAEAISAAVAQLMNMMDAAVLLKDPPEVMLGGGIKPMSEWPGHRNTQMDVLAAAQNGYGQDWFKFWHRAIAFEEVWGEGGVFDRARAKMGAQDYFKIMKWNQRLVIGAYGLGKSTRFAAIANHYAQKGIPTFSNGCYLGGWTITGESLFTAMQDVPKCCALGFDEAHGIAPSRLGNSTSVATVEGLNANIRKLVIDWSLIGNHWKEIHPLILEKCVEVEELQEAPVEIRGDFAADEPWNNPRNFRLVWNHWGNYPYKRMKDRQKERRRSNSKDADEEEEEGFGPPDSVRWLDLNASRWAFVLTDTWRLTDLTAITSRSDRVKAQLMGARDESIEGNRDPYEAAVVEFAIGLRAMRGEGQFDGKWVTAGDIAANAADEGYGQLSLTSIGRAVSSMGVKNRRNHGYPIDDLIRAAEAATGRRANA